MSSERSPAGQPGGRCWRQAAAVVLALALGVAAGPGQAGAEPSSTPRPPRLPSGPRYFGRVVRPVEPRSSLGLAAGHTWADRVRGVAREQWRWSLLVEGALGRAGLFLELPVVLDTARTEGVYGPGAASAAGLGDVRFGGDVRVLRFQVAGLSGAWGAGVQVTAPTGKERQVTPATPLLAAPAASFGPALWTLSGGTGLVVGPLAGFSAQLNADLVGRLRDEPDRPMRREDWLFGALALTLSYARLPWLVPLVQLDAQLELVGRNPLRQIVFLAPGLRLRPHRRVALDLGVRIPLGGESEAEQRLAAGLAITVGLGRRGEEAW